MQGRQLSILSLIVTIFIVEIQSTLLSKFFFGKQLYPQTIGSSSYQNVYPAYQNIHAPYYTYNLPQVHADLATRVPTITPDKVIPYTLTHPSTYQYYYGTPVYRLQFPIKPIFPVLIPTYPGFVPGVERPPTSTQRPIIEVDNGEDDDAIEKLDMKAKSETDKKEPSAIKKNEEDDFSVEVF